MTRIVKMLHKDKTRLRNILALQVKALDLGLLGSKDMHGTFESEAYHAMPLSHQTQKVAENEEHHVNMLAKAVEHKIVQELLHTEGKEVLMETSEESDNGGDASQLVPFDKDLLKPPTDVFDE